jgi:CHAD domain-containing protein
MLDDMTGPSPAPPDLNTLAAQLLDRCLEWLDDALAGDDVDTAVHDVRRTCKQLRALLRLVQVHDPELFKVENAATRDAAARLSDLRDAAVNLHSLTTLEQHDAGGSEPRPGASAGHLADHDRLRAGAAPSLRACREALAAQRRRCTTWDLPRWDDRDDVDAVVAAWTATYRAARRAGRQARKNSTTARLHEWRKRTKDHRLQLEFLAELNPEFGKRADDLHQLTDLLGDDHDLAVLAGTLQADQQTGRIASIDRRRRTLQKRARKLGKDLFAAPDDDMAQWLRGGIAQTGIMPGG